MLSILLTAAALCNPVSAAEATSGDMWAVGGASFGGAILGTAGGFGAGMGVASLVCSAGDQADGAWGCLLLSGGLGATVGYVGGTTLGGSWVASRRGLDAVVVRRYTWIAMGISGAVMVAGLGVPVLGPLGAAGFIVAVPISAGRAVTFPGKISVAPLLGDEAKGVVAQVYF